jgi:hypothetical protein
VLHGDADASSGRAGVQVRLEGPFDGRAPSVQRGLDDRPGSGAYRVVPLLRVLGDPGDRVVAVGYVTVEVPGVGPPVLRVLLVGAVSERDGWHEDADPGLTAAALARGFVHPGHVVDDPDPQVRVAVLAKALAEGTRNAVHDVREIRYELERAMARALHGPGSLKPVVASFYELAVVVNRARDVVRESIRGGLWLWVTDDDAYHRYRRAVDGALLKDVEPATAQTRPWMSVHDAGMRQCAAAESLLGEESRTIYDLLAGASTFSVARDAEAQEHLNVIATVAAIGLGLPALLLTLYSTDRLLPLTSRATLIAFVPILLTGLIAVAAATQRSASLIRTPTRLALAITALVLILLLLAGSIFLPDAAPIR